MAQTRTNILVFTLVGLALISTCSSSPKLEGTGDESSLISDLPPEVRDKFKVKDQTGTEVMATASPRPAPVAEATPLPQKTATVQPKKSPKLPSRASGLEYPVRRPKKDPIWVNESFSYEVTYSGMPAGDFNLKAAAHKYINGRKVYHIIGHAQSSKVFSLFYKLDDYIHSYIDYDGIFSHKFVLLLDESKQKRTSIEMHDYELKQTFFWDRRNHYRRGLSEKKSQREIPLWGQDTLSALYYLRAVKMPAVGEKIKFPLITQSKNWEAEVTLVRREVVESPLGRVKTLVLKPQTKFRGILKTRGDTFIWLTDDDRRIMVKLIAKVKIGAIKASLKSVESMGKDPAIHENTGASP